MVVNSNFLSVVQHYCIIVYQNRRRRLNYVTESWK